MENINDLVSTDLHTLTSGLVLHSLMDNADIK